MKMDSDTFLTLSTLMFSNVSLKKEVKENKWSEQRNSEVVVLYFRMCPCKIHVSFYNAHFMQICEYQNHTTKLKTKYFHLLSKNQLRNSLRNCLTLILEINFTGLEIELLHYYCFPWSNNQGQILTCSKYCHMWDFNFHPEAAA